MSVVRQTLNRSSKQAAFTSSRPNMSAANNAVKSRVAANAEASLVGKRRRKEAAIESIPCQYCIDNALAVTAHALSICFNLSRA
mmetsp:Transcript_33866/g.86928  ORF Transcript_33866/g.86928 Transcript_33866/m.86928 type:complete len:84 (-) Transcript_33866:697-948(-)